MDAAHLLQLMIYGLVAFALLRAIITTVDQAGTGFTALFVPSDHTLGWPHGVQESYEPWAWRPPATSTPELSVPHDLDAGDRQSTEPFSTPRTGSFVVEVVRVAPIRLRRLPN